MNYLNITLKTVHKILSNSKIFIKFLAKDEDAHEHPVEIPESAPDNADLKTILPEILRKIEEK